MNPHELARRFPNASLGCLSANHQDYGQDAATQSAIRDVPLATRQVEEGSSGRFLVRITSVRKRLADEDGLCGKFHTDCLRYAGFIPDDRPEICSIRTTQRKAAKGEEEHTLIEVFKI
jgi:hypothetical protein